MTWGLPQRGNGERADGKRQSGPRHGGNDPRVECAIHPPPRDLLDIRISRPTLSGGAGDSPNTITRAQAPVRPPRASWVSLNAASLPTYCEMLAGPLLTPRRRHAPPKRVGRLRDRRSGDGYEGTTLRGRISNRPPPAPDAVPPQ